MIRRIATAGVLVLAVSTAGSAQASDQFAKRADKICAQTTRKALVLAAKLPAAGNSMPSRAVMKRYGATWGQMRILLQGELHQIDALGGPSSPAARTAYRRWHTVFATVGLPALDTAARGATSGNYTKMNAALDSTEKYDAEMRKLEKTIGFTACLWNQ